MDRIVCHVGFDVQCKSHALLSVSRIRLSGDDIVLEAQNILFQAPTIYPLLYQASSFNKPPQSNLSQGIACPHKAVVHVPFVEA